MNGRELIIILRGEFGTIMLQLGKIEFRIIFFIPNIKILFFIFKLIINLYHIGCMIFDMRRKKKLKIYSKKRELPDWNDMAVWKDVRPAYVSEVV